MQMDELIIGNYYLWNDPDEGICSKAVRYIEPGNEPGVCAVAGTTGMDLMFYVLASELTQLPTTEEISHTARGCADLVMRPLYHFKDLYNIRVSKTGHVMIDLPLSHPIAFTQTTPGTCCFDLKAVSRMEIMNQVMHEGSLVPKKPSIQVNWGSDGFWISPGSKELTENLFYVLNRLRLYFTGFLEKPFEDETDYPLSPENSAYQFLPEAVKEILYSDIAHSRCFTRSDSEAEVSAYAADVVERLNQHGGYWEYDITVRDDLHAMRLKHVYAAAVGTMIDFNEPSVIMALLQITTTVVSNQD